MELPKAQKYGLVIFAMKDPKDTTIAVGMSGGVDSSVAAALLKKQGYNVVGFFMKNWGDTYGLKESECPWVQDREDALRVAAVLDIPIHTLDFEEEYKNQVLEYFFKEYEAGRTPNPDVMCNSQIKFGVFLREALKLGADYIATGHYARVGTSSKFQVQSDNNHTVISSEAKRSREIPLHTDIKEISPLVSTLGRNDEDVHLLKGIDENKDQSYFLYRLTSEQLSKSIFPIGEIEKPKVRELAKEFGLPTAEKRDSQGVCFVGHLDLQKFLKQKINEQPGDIVLTDGKKVGEHTGLFWYTTGQRKGINVGGIGPLYVVEKDFKTNQLVVTHNRDDERLYTQEVILSDVNWINGWDSIPKHCEGRIRYREKLSTCTVEKIEDDRYRVVFAEPQWAVAAGQSVVLYDHEVCLGGGVIQ